MAAHLSPQSNAATAASNGQNASNNDSSHDNFFQNSPYLSHDQSVDSPWGYPSNQLNFGPGSHFDNVPSWSPDAQAPPPQTHNYHNGFDQGFAHLNNAYGNQQFNSHPGFGPYHQPQTSQLPPHTGSGPGPQNSQYSFPSASTQHQQPPQPQPQTTPQHVPSNTNQTQGSSGTESKSQTQAQAQKAMPTLADERAFPKMPPGTVSGIFVVTSLDSLQQQVKVTKVHNFLDIGAEPSDLQITKSTIPAYNPRKSRNEIKKLLANNSKLSAKITKKAKSSTTSGPKVTRLDSAALQKLDSSAQRGSSSSEEESSDDGSDGSSSEEEVEQAPLPAKRPDLPLEATEYDTVKALWRPSTYTLLSKEDITKGLMAFWEIMGSIKDRWKIDSAAVKEAEEAKKLKDLPVLKQRVTVQRDMLERALRAAVDKGHADIIETSFGEHLQLMQTLAIFLQDRARELDYGGPLSMAILKLLARCKTLTESKLVQTSVGKVLTRFEKRGDDKVKQLVKQININAAAATKKKKEQSKGPIAGSSSATSKAVSDSPSKTPAATAGVKRARVGEGANGQPLKKVAGDTTKSAASAVKEVKATEQTATIKPKPATSFFSALKPAKRVPQAADAQSNSQSAAGLKSSTPAATATASSNAAAAAKPSIFADTMASLMKPKEAEPVVKKEEPKIEETEEERKKRLRKESRRRLRVTFKPDASLVEVRYFTHDPDEELGHDANQVKDAGDIGSEGRMFKLQHKEDMMDLDEDDESEPPINTTEPIDKPYDNLSFVDFSALDEEQREQNFEPYGGGKAAKVSPETEAQQRRESETLMAIYTTSEDVPATPKEAPQDSNESSAETGKTLGAVPEWVVKRGETVKGLVQSPPTMVPSVPAGTDFNLAAALNNLTSTAQGQQMQQQQTATSNPISSLEQLFAQHATPAAAPQQAQDSSNQPNPLAAIFSTLSQQGQPQQQQTPPQLPFPMPTQQTSQASSTNSTQPDLSGILALLSQHGNPQGQQQSGQQQAGQQQGFPGMPNFLFPQQQQPSQTQTQTQNNQQQFPGFPPLPPMPSNNNNQYHSPPHQPSQLDEQNNKRSASSDFDSNGNKRQRQWTERGEWVADGNKNDPRNPNKGVPFRVVPCKYYREGKCRKGDGCTFKHE